MTAVSTANHQGKASISKHLWHWVWVLPLLAVMALAAFIIIRPIQVLPRITLSPGYVFVDQQGNQLTSEDMRGKITLYNFTYTNCLSPCVPTAPLLQEVQTRLGELDQGEMPIEFVTISIDPQRDTPQTLAAYADSLDADPDIWHFVTGTPERLKWVIGAGFGLYYNQRDDGSLILDTGIMLVDWTGTLRAEYRHKMPDIDIVMRDLGLLLTELENSKGAGRYAYEAAHLFSCYPR